LAYCLGPPKHLILNPSHKAPASPAPGRSGLPGRAASCDSPDAGLFRGLACTGREPGGEAGAPAHSTHSTGRRWALALGPPAACVHTARRQP
jgi:hypothetical protein